MLTAVSEKHAASVWRLIILFNLDTDVPLFWTNVIFLKFFKNRSHLYTLLFSCITDTPLCSAIHYIRAVSSTFRCRTFELCTSVLICNLSLNMGIHLSSNSANFLRKFSVPASSSSACKTISHFRRVFAASYCRDLGSVIKTSPCGICSGKSSARAGFPPAYFEFPSQHKFSNVPYPCFIPLPQTLCKLSNWQHH